MNAHDWACRYQNFYKNLSLETLPDLHRLLAEDAHYHDPFLDIRGRDRIIEMFRNRLSDVQDVSYTFTHCACDGNVCFLRWHYTSRPKTIRTGLPWICDGVTEVHFNEAGQVVHQIQHWDLGEQVYEKLPVLRAIIRWAKSRVRTWTP